LRIKKREHVSSFGYNVVTTTTKPEVKKHAQINITIGNEEAVAFFV